MASGRHPFDVVARILAERLRGREPSAALRTTLSGRQIDWGGVIGRASDHYALAGLAAAMRDLDLAVSLDLEVREFLAAVHAASIERNQELRDQLAEAVAALNRADIEPVLLKGAIRLVDDLYPDIGWRMMRDLDILVPESQLRSAVEALREAGYDATRPTTRSPRAASERAHLPALRHPGRLALVEVHRRLFLSSRRLLDAAEVFDGSRFVTFEGAIARMPSTEHQITHLIGHCQVTDHGYALASIQLRDLLEAAALARWSAERVDWRIVSARFAAAGYHRPFLTFLLSLDDLSFYPLPAGYPADLLTTVQRRRVMRRAHSPTIRGMAFGTWIMVLLKNFVLEGETRRHILSLPVKEIVRRLCRRGPRGRLRTDLQRS